MPRLNLNQAGGSLGGPIKRDRLFFYVNYEAYRLRNQAAEDATVLTPDARNGIFTYLNANGNVVKQNLLSLVGLNQDPVMASLLAQVPTKINNFRVGDSQAGLLMNTAGYSYLVRNNDNQDNVTGRLDYYLTTKNSLMTTFAWNRLTVDRPDVGIGYETVSPFQNNDAIKFLSSAWRYSPKANFTNEVRGGFNLAPATFGYNGALPPYLVGGTLYTSPQAAENSSILSQGRYTNTYALQDNASWIHGRHSLKFGFQYQGVRVRTYDFSGTIPAYNVGTTSSFQGGYLLGLQSCRVSAISNWKTPILYWLHWGGFSITRAWYTTLPARHRASFRALPICAISLTTTTPFTARTNGKSVRTSLLRPPCAGIITRRSTSAIPSNSSP